MDLDAADTPELYRLHTYLQIALWTTLCAACNLVIKYRMQLTRRSTRAFYLQHSLFNAVICYLTWDDMVFTLRHPLDSALCAHTAAGDCAPSTALFVMLGIHVAHCLTDHATLTITDYVHHALSCGMSGYFMLVYRLGAVKNFALFYSCGLPGGITYLALFCAKNGWLGRLTEKRLATVVNQWLRAPMLFLMGYIVLLCHTEGRLEKAAHGLTNEMPLGVLLSMVAAVSLNGLYFSQLVAVSYGKSLVHAALPSSSDKKNTGIRPNVSFIQDFLGRPRSP